MRIFLCVLFGFIVFERVFFTFLKRTEPKGVIFHKTLTLFVITNYTFCAFFSFIDFLVRGIVINISPFSFGIFLFILGVILRVLAVKTLGDNWSIHTKKITGQRLVKKGIYKVFRHPYYLAVILELTGIALIYNSFISLIFVFFLQLLLLGLRIKLEEVLLLEEFGEEYKIYQSKTSIL